MTGLYSDVFPWPKLSFEQYKYIRGMGKRMRVWQTDATTESDYVLPGTNPVTKMAPFGTQNTPVYRVKIIGGKPVTVREDPINWDAVSPRQNGDAYYNGHPTKQQGNFQSPSLPYFQSLTEKPNNFDPTPFTQRTSHTRGNVSNREELYDNAHFHRSTKNALNPHRVVPPIGTPDSDIVPIRDLTTTSEDNPINKEWITAKRVDSTHTELIRHLPNSSMYLPKRPVQFNKSEELELSNRIRFDLKDFDAKRLKALYMMLSVYDKSLTGSMNMTDMSSTFSRAQVPISPTNLRLVAAQFVDGPSGTRVNYEKVLSFIGGCLKGHSQQQQSSITSESQQQQLQQQQQQQQQYNPSPQPYQQSSRYQPSPQQQYPQQQPQQPSYQQSPRHQQSNGVQFATSKVPNRSEEDMNGGGNWYNAGAERKETFEDPMSPRTTKNMHGEHNNAELLKLIESQLLQSGADLDFEMIWRVFANADRDRRGKMSRDQIKYLSYRVNLPLQVSVLDEIIDKVESSNGQYNWQQYLNFIEKVAPINTGLQFPESKKPSEYVKKVPEPSTNWPNESVFSTGKQKMIPGTEDRDPTEIVNHYQKEKETYDEKQRQMLEMERQLQMLESEVRRERDEKENKAREEQNRSVPWFDRFMKLANKLYELDYSATGGTGYLNRHVTKDTVLNYNSELSLCIPEKDIDRLIERFMESGKVNIGSLLVELKSFET